MAPQRLHLEGRLDRYAARSVYHTVSSARNGDVVVELADPRPDAVALAALVAAARAIRERGSALVIEGAPEVATAVEQRLQAPAPEPSSDAGESRLSALGERAYAEITSLGVLAETLADSIADLFRLVARRARMPRGALSDQMVAMGADGVGIVTLLAALLGMILAFEASDELTDLGATAYIANVVGFSLVREFAPLLTAIVLIGRSGAAVASELATMAVHQEVDALRTMGIAPTSFLVSPRVLALALVQPALTLLATFVGLTAGLITTNLATDISALMFYNSLTDAIGFGDVVYGVSKGLVFAISTALICCAVGLQTRGGALEVGRATTRAVVLSILMLVVLDSAFAFTSGTMSG